MKRLALLLCFLSLVGNSFAATIDLGSSGPTPIDSITISSLTITNQVLIGNGSTISTCTTAGFNISGALGFDRRTSTQIKATTPTLVGQSFFDTTLKQPVWATGTTTSFDWVTATGTKPSGY